MRTPFLHFCLGPPCWKSIGSSAKMNHAHLRAKIHRFRFCEVTCAKSLKTNFKPNILFVAEGLHYFSLISQYHASFSRLREHTWVEVSPWMIKPCDWDYFWTPVPLFWKDLFWCVVFIAQRLHTAQHRRSGMAADNTMSNGEETASLNGEPAVKRSRENEGTETLRNPREPQNKVTVVLGAQWGDEGKGKVVDLLAMDADIVCRCQVRRCI